MRNDLEKLIDHCEKVFFKMESLEKEIIHKDEIIKQLKELVVWLEKELKLERDTKK